MTLRGSQGQGRDEVRQDQNGLISARTATSSTHTHTHTHTRMHLIIITTVACSAAQRRDSVQPLYFADASYFLCLSHIASHLLRRQKTVIPEISHTTWLSPHQNLCYIDFFKVLPKTNGLKNKTSTIFRANSQTLF